MINAGAMLVASANELVFLFVGLELVSIPTYLLLYLSRRNPVHKKPRPSTFSLASSRRACFSTAWRFCTGRPGSAISRPWRI